MRDGRLWLLLVLVLSCARIQAPPGAEADREGPVIHLIKPAPGEQVLGLQPEFLLEFNEYVNRGSLLAALSLNPQSSAPLDFSWRGRRVRVRPTEALLAGHTYSLQVGTALKDMAGNPLREPLQLLFGTTAPPDSLALSARFHGKLRNQAELWLWPMDSLNAKAPARPMWRGSPDSLGHVTLRGLPARPLFAMAVCDRNHDGRWQAASEEAALPDGEALASLEPRALHFLPGKGLFLAGAEGLKGKVLDPLLIELSGRLDPPALARLDAKDRQGPLADSLRLASLLLESLQGEAIPLLAMARPEAGIIQLHLAESLDSLALRLLLDFSADTVRLGFPRSMRLPALQADPDWLSDSLLLAFERPVSLTEQSAFRHLPAGEGDSLLLVASQLDPFHLLLSGPEKQLLGGGRLEIAASSVRGMGGSSWPDSLIKLRLPEKPRQAELATGGLEWSLDRLPREVGWRIRLLGDAGLLDDRPLAGQDEVEGLPVGPVRFAVYLDRNLDGRWNPGQLEALEWAEPWLDIEGEWEIIEGWVQGGLRLHLPERIP